jgi:hypothetical protein
MAGSTAHTESTFSHSATHDHQHWNRDFNILTSDTELQDCIAKQRRMIYSRFLVVVVAVVAVVAVVVVVVVVMFGSLFYDAFSVTRIYSVE